MFAFGFNSSMMGWIGIGTLVYMLTANLAISYSIKKISKI
jgi:hypothetical protein